MIIGDRNAKCLEVLDREVLAGKKKLGIFYGAAHFPDMEKRLVAGGWTKTGDEWDDGVGDREGEMSLSAFDPDRV